MRHSIGVTARRMTLLLAAMALTLAPGFAQEEPPEPPATGPERAAAALADNLDRQVTHLEAVMLEVPEAAQNGLARALEAITAAMVQDVLAGVPAGPPSDLPALALLDIRAALEFPDLPDLPPVVTLPDLPELPGLPNLPDLPDLPELPDVAHGPGLPELPDVPGR